MRRAQMALAIVGLLIVGLLTTASASTASATHHKRHRKTPVKQVAPEPVPDLIIVPPPPPVPMHEAAVPPKVSYVNGSLTIEAKNSTLSDVLKSVEKLTGASFEISSGDTSERVVGIIGPGPARDVLAMLLNGSRFNYVMLSPLGDPSALSRVLLTPRGAALAQTGQQSNPQFQQPYPQQVQISPALAVQQQNASADEAADNGDTPDENADGQEQQDAQADPAQGAQVPQPPQPGVKTPEQLLQELRQQQQQVIQQQQNQPPGQVPPEDNK